MPLCDMMWGADSFFFSIFCLGFFGIFEGPFPFRQEGVTDVTGLVSGRAMSLVTVTLLAGSWQPAYPGLVTALAICGPSPAPSPHSSGAPWYAPYTCSSGMPVGYRARLQSELA